MFLVVMSLVFHSLPSVGIIATYHIRLQQWGSTASLPFLSTFYFYTCWKPSPMLFLLSHYCSRWLNVNLVCCLPSVRPNPESSIALFRCRFLFDIVLLVPEDPSVLFICSPSSTRLIINSITFLETVLVSPYFWKGLLMDIEFSALRAAACCDFSVVSDGKPTAVVCLFLVWLCLCFAAPRIFSLSWGPGQWFCCSLFWCLFSSEFSELLGFGSDFSFFLENSCPVALCFSACSFFFFWDSNHTC